MTDSVTEDDLIDAFMYLRRISEFHAPNGTPLGDRHFVNAARIAHGEDRHPHALEDAILAD